MATTCKIRNNRSTHLPIATTPTNPARIAVAAQKYDRHCQETRCTEFREHLSQPTLCHDMWPRPPPASLSPKCSQSTRNFSKRLPDCFWSDSASRCLLAPGWRHGSLLQRTWKNQRPTISQVSRYKNRLCRERLLLHQPS